MVNMSIHGINISTMDTENQTDFVAVATLAAMCFEQSPGSPSALLKTRRKSMIYKYNTSTYSSRT
jgi:hypothetical protein